MNKLVKKGYAFPEKAPISLRSYIDLNDLIVNNSDLQNYCGVVPYIVRSIEKLIQHNIEVTDCTYLVFKGSITKPVPSEDDGDKLLYESDYLLRIENLRTKNILDVYYGVANEDGSHEISMCRYCETHSTIIRCQDLTGEMAEYINILCANRSGMKAIDKNIRNDAKYAVYNIEMWVHEILKNNSTINKNN